MTQIKIYSDGRLKELKSLIQEWADFMHTDFGEKKRTVDNNEVIFFAIEQGIEYFTKLNTKNKMKIQEDGIPNSSDSATSTFKDNDEKEIDMAVEDVIKAIKSKQRKEFEAYPIGDIEKSLYETLPSLMQRWEHLSIIKNSMKAGMATSERKAKASRENGKKGGRPKKTAEQTDTTK